MIKLSRNVIPRELLVIKDPNLRAFTYNALFNLWIIHGTTWTVRLKETLDEIVGTYIDILIDKGTEVPEGSLSTTVSSLQKIVLDNEDLITEHMCKYAPLEQAHMDVVKSNSTSVVLLLNKNNVPDPSEPAEVKVVAKRFKDALQLRQIPKYGGRKDETDYVQPVTTY